ncbi:hypothetical protein G6F59_017552 [Rhizopus arrhizus]|nr:hypothetical protein G6F59_017552 [Rhizopus arrhizus]
MWSSAAGWAPTSSSASASTVPTVMATVPWASRARRCSWARWHWTGAARARASPPICTAPTTASMARHVALAWRRAWPFRGHRVAIP